MKWNGGGSWYLWAPARPGGAGGQAALDSWGELTTSYRWMIRWWSLRNFNRLKFKTCGNLSTVIEEYIEYISLSIFKKTRKITNKQPVGLGIVGIFIDYAQNCPGHYNSSELTWGEPELFTLNVALPYNLITIFAAKLLEKERVSRGVAFAFSLGLSTFCDQGHIKVYTMNSIMSTRIISVTL